MPQDIDKIIFEELLKSLRMAEQLGTPKMRFNQIDYTPTRLIEHVEKRTQVGIDYYNLFAKYREIIRNFKP